LQKNPNRCIPSARAVASEFRTSSVEVKLYCTDYCHYHLHTNNPPSTTIIPRFDFTNSPHLYETSIPRYIEGARKETVIREAEVIIAGRQASQGDIGYRTPDKGRLANAGRERISREPAATEPRIFKEVIGKIWAKYQEAQRAGSSP